MAIDYSTLTDEELKAIANNDYSKLSDATLEAIANKPKSAQPKPVEGAGGAAFGVYRPQGRRPESQQDREASKDMALQTVRGAVSAPFTATAGLPVDIGNAVYGQAVKPVINYVADQTNGLRLPQYTDLPPAVQTAGNVLGGAYNTIVRGQEFQPLPEVPKAEKMPGIGDYGMNFYNQFVPGQEPTNAAGQLAFAGGQALTTPLSNKVIGGVMAAPKVVRGGAKQIGTGAMEGVTNPVQRPGPNTAFAELGENVYPNETVKPWMAQTPEARVQGLPALEASQQPSSSLFNGFLDKAALRLAPEGPAGGKLVPLEGKGLQAFTEQTIRDLFNKPKSFGDMLSGKYGNIGGALAGLAVGGFPGAAAGFFAPQYVKALEILGQRRLQNKAALQPGFQQQLGEAQQTAGRLGIEGNMPPTTPALGYTPAAGAIPPTMYVNPQGQATTNLAGTEVNMNPGSMAAPTPAANAAMATTQAKASTTPRAQPQPRPQPQPKPEWRLPTEGEHYNYAAEQLGPDASFGEVFEKAVAERTKALLHDAKKNGQKLTPGQADAQAYDDIKKWRSQNVEAFKPVEAPEMVGPVQPKPTADEAFAEFNKPKVDPELEMDQRIWKRLQDKDAAGTPLEVNEETAVRRITNKYGPDPFGTGGLPNYTAMLPEAESTTPKQTRDTTRRTAKKEFFKALEDDNVDVDKALAKYESTVNKRQMDVYLDALKEAEGKLDPQSLANYALRQKNLPTFDGSVTQKRNAPSPSHKLESQLAETWYDELLKIAKEDDKLAGDKNKQSQGFLKQQLEKYGGDKAEMMRNSNFTGKSIAERETPKVETSKEEMPGASLFESPIGNAPKDVMKMTTGQTTHANIKDAAGDLMVKQMTNNNGMFETSYNKGKDVVSEKKYPGYHSVEITHPDGTMTIFKKNQFGNEAQYIHNSIDKNGNISVVSNTSTKPKGWISVEDEITKGK